MDVIMEGNRAVFVAVFLITIMSFFESSEAIKCSICRATKSATSGTWSDDAECMFYPPQTQACDSDRYTDCVTTLKFDITGSTVGITRDCEQTNFKTCWSQLPLTPRGQQTSAVQPHQPSKVCSWTCGTDSCNATPIG
ncbi:uncharacterized protein LOC135490715 [Lineus longissimus]|uniref:uncharacterized protein LOC135490715 n=1 Tax=Lineus longissimus TaxID=88925 RepID=UPI002B4C9B5C